MDGNDTHGRKRKGGTGPIKTPATKRFNTAKEEMIPKVSPEDLPIKQIPRTHQWQIGQIVSARIFSANGPSEWRPALVTATHDDITIEGVEYDYAIGVHVKNSDDQYVPACTWHEKPHPIPKGKTGSYLRGKDELAESLPENQRKQLRLMRANMAKKSVPRESRESDMSTDDGILDGILLGDFGQEHHLSLREQLLHLRSLEEVSETIKLATGREEPELSVMNLLAYLTGQAAGMELSEQSATREEKKEMSGKRVLEKISDNAKSKIEQFQDIPCDVTKIFMTAGMQTRTKKGKKPDPKRALLDKRGRTRLENETELNKAMAKLLTALMCIHSSQSRDTQVSGPGSGAVMNGLRLILDEKGVNDKLLGELAREGVAAPAGLLRMFLRKAAAAIDEVDVREDPPDGLVGVLCTVLDNSDFLMNGAVLSVVPFGDILIGHEKEEEARHFNETFIDGLPLPTDEMASCITPTAKDDEEAKVTIRNQNLLALMNAVNLVNGSLSNDDSIRPLDNASEWSVGDTVTFRHRHSERTGVVRSINGDMLEVFYIESNGDDAAVSVPSGSVSAPAPDVDGADDTNEAEDSDSQCIDLTESIDEEEAKYWESWIPGVDDGGGRHKGLSSTTIIREVVDGISSKHHETAATLMERIQAYYGSLRVLTVVADQEFLPTILNMLFASLVTGERLNLLPFLALGHANKSQAMSHLSYFSCIFDQCFKAQGVAVDSPAYKRIRNGRNIRDTTRFTLRGLEALRAAMAKKYLEEQGESKVICDPETGELCSPLKIIEEYFSAFEEGTFHDLEKESIVCVDQHMRPQVLYATSPMILVANDFQRWTSELGGETGGYYVGPSGYAYGPADETDNAETVAADSIGHAIEPEYQFISRLTWRQEGNEIGLYQRCKNARIVDPALPRSRPVLESRYYVYYKTLRETNSENAAREAALSFVPVHQRSIPDGCLPFGTAINQYLNGPEAFALIQSILITRVQEQDNDDERCDSCRRSNRRCRCHHKKKVLVLLKSLACVFMSHKNTHYSRLSVNCILLMIMILEHPDSDCCFLALQRINGTTHTNESGDSWTRQAIDLQQETRLVGTTKKQGARDPHSVTSMQDRVKVSSYGIAKDVERKAKDFDLGELPPYRPTQKKDESRSFALNVATFGPLVEALVEQRNLRNPKLTSIPSTELEIGSPSRLIFRGYDALQHLQATGKHFALGIRKGAGEVAMPPRKYPSLTTAHRQIPSASRLKSSRNEEVEKSIQMAKEAQNYARIAKFAMVPSSNDMFGSLENAGEGKSDFLKPLLSLLGTNEPYQPTNHAIGDGPSSPIVLSTSRIDMRNKMQRRVGNGAPIVAVVDLMMLLQTKPPSRSNGQFTLSTTELARDIITMISKQYYYRQVSLVVACMDVNEKTSRLRHIAHAKRHKVQSTQTQFYALERIRSPRDPLDSLGTFATLMKSGKDSFVVYLADEIVNQMKVEDCPEEDWYPSRLFGNAAFGFIGGSDSACAFIGPLNVKISSNCYVDRRSLEERMKTVVDQGEGECMIFSMAHRLLTKGFEDTRDPLDCCLDIHCEDTDAFAGMSMYFAYCLESESRNGGNHFNGSIMIRAHKKSASQVMAIGKRFKESLGFEPGVDPTGNGYYLQHDVIAWCYGLEQCSNLATLPRGHRAVAATVGAYALVNNDYIAVNKRGGMNYRDFLNALTSKELQNVIDSRPGSVGQQEYSPMNLEPIAFDVDSDDGVENKTGINLPGMLLCFAIMMIHKKDTRRLLCRRYPPSEMTSFFPTTIPFDVIRAAAHLAGEKVPVPDPLALLSRLACADYIMHVWLRRPYQRSIQPAVGNGELVATPYLIPEKMTNGKECSIEYSLVSLKTRLAAVQDDSEATRKVLESSCFGRLMCRYQLDDSFSWLFRPLDEVSKAVEARGLYPSPHVAADLVLPTFQADNPEELVGFVTKFKTYLSNDEDRLHGANCLREVYELTLCSRTAYNPDGAKLGRPLLISHKPEDISTGGFSDRQQRWPKKTQWTSTTIQELSKLPCKDLFPKLQTTDCDNVIKLFEELCLYVFSNSSGVPLSNLESRVALARTAPAEDPDDSMTEDNEEEESRVDDSVMEEIGTDEEKYDDEMSELEFCDDND